MAGIKLLLLIYICAAALTVSAAMDPDKVYAAEESNKDLPCPPYTGQQWTWKAWFYGLKTITDTFSEDHLIYREFKDGSKNGTDNTTAKTTIDPASFNLTINNVLLSDNLELTCRYAYFDGVRNNNYDQARIQLLPYIQPQIPQMDPPPDPNKKHPVTDAEDLTVTCTIPRLYPAIVTEDFTMTWGGTDVCPGTGCTFKGDPQPDTSIRYTLTYVWTADKNNVPSGVTCTIKPVHGSTTTSHPPLKIEVQYGPQNTPTVTIDQQYVHPYVYVSFYCLTEAVDAYPVVSKVNWTVNGATLPQKDFNFTRLVKYEDSGDYSCSVGNDIDFSQYSNPVFLNVSALNEAPVLLIDKINPSKEESVTFHCMINGIKGIPEARPGSFKSGERLTSWNTTVVEHIIRSDDSGSYTCCALRSVGSSAHSNVVVVRALSEYPSKIGLLIGIPLLVASVIIMIGIGIILAMRRKKPLKATSGDDNIDSYGHSNAAFDPDDPQNHVYDQIGERKQGKLPNDLNVGEYLQTEVSHDEPQTPKMEPVEGQYEGLQVTENNYQKLVLSNI